MIALYARQSVEKEGSVSIETQLDYCKSMIKINEQSKEVNYYIDKGFSGGNIERPAFQQLINDIELGKIEKVIVYKLDRISRSLSDFVNIQKIFEKYNVGFVSSQESFDTSSPYGDVILKILMVFAEFERTSIINRVRDAYQKRSDMGFYMGGRQQYGFELKDTLIDDKKTKMLVPIKEQMEHVKFIYTLYSLNNVSLRKVQKALIKNHFIPSIGSGWPPSKINAILKNPVYVKADIDIYNYFLSKNVNIINSPQLFDGSHAAVLYGRTCHCSTLSDWSDMKLVLAPHEGVISSDIWLKCQQKTHRNKQLGKSMSNQSSWLAGKIYCGLCGKKMTTINSSRSDGTKRIYFTCSNKLNKKTCSGTVTIHADDIENLIYTFIISKLSKINTIPKTFGYHKIQQIYNIKTKLAELSEKKNQLKKFLLSAELNIIAAEMVNSQAEQLHNEQCILINKLNSLQKKDYQHIDSDFLLDLWTTASFEEKRAVSDILIERINISGDGDIEIVWNI
ncbi:MAG: recombinase family protein [Candidatus Metalachnospira sp.]|nr:recombinase family protein [Candidatus Metalachnospira sp.]